MLCSFSLQSSVLLTCKIHEAMGLSASKFSQPLAKHEDERSVHDIEQTSNESEVFKIRLVVLT